LNYRRALGVILVLTQAQVSVDHAAFSMLLPEFKLPRNNADFCFQTENNKALAP
jgi:hypothetical protein